MFSYTFLWLVQKLFPNGRAFRMPERGIMYRFFRALSPSFERVYSAARAIQDVQLPDNPNFTIDDAHEWYRRLGIYDSGLVSLDDMKARIRQAMSFPATDLATQSAQFIQDQLQAAGFNVYVHKNRFTDGSTGGFKTLYPWLLTTGSALVSPTTLCGTLRCGQGYSFKIVNYIEPEKDALFNIGSNYRATFFIGGALKRGPRVSPTTRVGATIIGHDLIGRADVDVNRKIEFSQLVLKLKSAHMVAYAFINFV